MPDDRMIRWCIQIFRPISRRGKHPFREKSELFTHRYQIWDLGWLRYRIEGKMGSDMVLSIV
ncbi:MAG: hypothetical protein EA377_10445 [Phycisphaerales bacterium]|nr:MAG: hypothetical protein EA377_10445 [Phycisphaerales bacterium]